MPRSARAPEGDGYLIGVVDRTLEARSDLLILDAQRLAEGPLATVRMPFRIFSQIHGWWVAGRAAPPGLSADRDSYICAASGRHRLRPRTSACLPMRRSQPFTMR